MKFPWKKEKEVPVVDVNIEILENELLVTDPTSDEYETITDNLKKLYDMRDKGKVKREIPWTAIVSGLASLIGVGAVLLVESKDVIITSKAERHLPKP